MRREEPHRGDRGQGQGCHVCGCEADNPPCLPMVVQVTKLLKKERKKVLLLEEKAPLLREMSRGEVGRNEASRWPEAWGKGGGDL